MRGQGEAPSVGGLLAEVLTGRARRVAELWPAELGGDGGEALAVPADQAAQLVTAVIAALRDGDAQPLMGIAVLRPGADLATAPLRVERVLRGIDAVRRALVTAIEEEGVEPGLRAALERQAPTAFARASRTFAVWAARVVARDALDRSAPGAGDGDTLGVTIHELRRPLTILSSYVQLLVAGTLGELSEKSAAAVRAMAQATETMSRLVDGLSAVARLADPAHQPTLTELSAAEVITAAAAEVALEAELRSVSIDLDVDGSLLLRGDAEELVLALRNLLGNAIKHAPEGTAVSISAHGDGPAVRVLVRDLGPGFPAHEAPRLFEKYYRAAAERERGLAGSGLGLFIVTSVARRHGGTASARPLPDGGAEFELAIPRS